MSRKYVYLKPSCIELKTSEKRYMAAGGGYISNVSIAPYSKDGRKEKDRKILSKWSINHVI